MKDHSTRSLIGLRTLVGDTIWALGWVVSLGSVTGADLGRPWVVSLGSVTGTALVSLGLLHLATGAALG